MEQTVFKIESSLDFYRITEALTEQNIPFAERKFEDSTFPSFGQGKVFAEIIVDPQYAEIAAKIVAGEPFAEKDIPISAVQSPPPRKKRSTAIIILVLYALVSTVFAVKFWHDSTRAGESKNFKGSWNYTGTTYTEEYIPTGKTLSVYVDANFDRNYEFARYYDKSGALLSETEDRNEDGILDKMTSFDLEGKVCGLSHDTDLDGNFDIVLNVLENSDTIYFYDFDNDSRYDSLSPAKIRQVQQTNN